MKLFVVSTFDHWQKEISSMLSEYEHTLSVLKLSEEDKQQFPNISGEIINDINYNDYEALLLINQYRCEDDDVYASFSDLRYVCPGEGIDVRQSNSNKEFPNSESIGFSLVSDCFEEVLIQLGGRSN